jgi:hypothetical protein
MITKPAIGFQSTLPVYKMMVRFPADVGGIKLGMVFGKQKQRSMTKDGAQNLRFHIMYFDSHRKVNTFGASMFYETLVEKMKETFGC